MKNVKSASLTSGIYLLLTGIIFILFHVIILFIRKESLFVGIVFFVLGILLLIIGVTLLLLYLKTKRRLAYLKMNGNSFTAEIVSIARSFLVKINRRTFAYAICRFTEKSGKKRSVKSRRFIIEKNRLQILSDIAINNYQAIVYINSNDPSDYEVEMFISQ